LASYAQHLLLHLLRVRPSAPQLPLLRQVLVLLLVDLLLVSM
jgi:hypothetical protein